MPRLPVWKAVGRWSDQLDQDFEARQQELRDQFQFIAAAIWELNFDQEKIARLQEIAKQTWVRHFDDGLGLAESQRNYCSATDQLPVVEQLLSDQPWQRKKRSESEALPEGYGFDLDVPEDTFNYGGLQSFGKPWNINAGGYKIVSMLCKRL